MVLYMYGTEWNTVIRINRVFEAIQELASHLACIEHVDAVIDILTARYHISEDALHVRRESSGVPPKGSVHIVERALRSL